MGCRCCSELSPAHLVVEDAPDGLHNGPLLHSARRARRQQGRVQEVAARQTSQLLASACLPESTTGSHYSVSCTECWQQSHVGSGAAQRADAPAAPLQLSCDRKAEGLLLPGRDQSDIHGFTAISRGESLSVGPTPCDNNTYLLAQSPQLCIDCV